MFKKVVLFSLLSVAMAFSMGVNVGAEGNKYVKTCKQICYLMKDYEKQNLEKLEHMKKEMDLVNMLKFEINKEYVDNASPIVKNDGFNEDAKSLESVYDFRLKFENKKIKLIKKIMGLTENSTMYGWRKYNEICPNVYCEGEYNEKSKSLSWGRVKNKVSGYYQNLFTKKETKAAICEENVHSTQDQENETAAINVNSTQGQGDETVAKEGKDL